MRKKGSLTWADYAVSAPAAEYVLNNSASQTADCIRLGL